MVTTTHVLTSVQDGVMQITLNRPEVRNALIPEMTARLGDAFEEAAADADVRLVVFGGAGITFCAGGDAKYKSAGFEHGWAQFERAVKIMEAFPKIIVTKAQGHAIGAGCTLALLGDFVFAADDTRFHFPFVHIGLVPEGTHLITRLLRPVAARSFVLLGEPLTGAEAQAVGLIHRAVPADELDGAVSDFARRLLSMPRWSVDLIKQGLRYAGEHSAAESLAWEEQNQAEIRGAPWFEEFRQTYFERAGVGRSSTPAREP